MAEKKEDAKRATEARSKAKPLRGQKPDPSSRKDAPAKAAPKRAVARPVTRAVARPVAEKPRAARAERPAAPRRKAEPRPLPTAPSGQAPVIAADGSVSGSVELPAAIAASKRRTGVLFQALTAATANARQATAATKNRARVSGGGAKPWRQKGTGRARQGSTRSPHWRHGGVVFGPNGRRYEQRIPEKMRRAAFAEALQARASDGRFLVYEGLKFEDDRPRTKTVVDWLGKIGDTGTAVLVTGEIDALTARAAANASEIGVRTAGTLSTEDVLRYDTLVVRRDALAQLATRASANGGAA